MENGPFEDVFPIKNAELAPGFLGSSWILHKPPSTVWSTSSRARNQMKTAVEPEDHNLLGLLQPVEGEPSVHTAESSVQIQSVVPGDWVRPVSRGWLRCSLSFADWRALRPGPSTQAAWSPPKNRISGLLARSWESKVPPPKLPPQEIRP